MTIDASRVRLLSLLVATGAATSAHAQSYAFEVIDLASSPFAQGGVYATVGGISDDGSTVLGNGVDPSTGLTNVFRWTASGGFSVLPVPAGYDFLSVLGFSSDLKHLVGTVNKDGEFPFAASWNAAGVATIYQGLSSNQNDGIFAVSDDGSVLLGQASLEDYSARAASFHPGSPATNGGLIPGYPILSVYSKCSSDGSVKIVSGQSETDFVFARQVGSGAFELIPDAPGTLYQYFVGISPDGNTLVGSANEGETSVAVKWSQEVGASMLDHEPGTYTWAYDLTPDGSRIVGATSDYFLETGFPVLWENGSRIDLWTLLQSNGVSVPSDLIANVALGISANGSKILGHGIDTTLKMNRFWIATIPPLASSCYADCDASGGLNIDDFVCFQTFFALGDLASDCDASGDLTIDDFICFQTLFAIGC